ncbi:MADS-box transcription factor 6 [Dorcoceras hygrometricum]|uniref:MADS-box transcription factor 6 n=1 Tax=Dorcoceras hygrometricum TaxID=472368 RepID=A0A2Z7ABN7_9LAMI|nr:MADS-box transcription factor 6 [Dorcoceras hygrometricum]
MSLFNLQDVCIAIGSIATLDLPMVVDLIGIYGLKGPYCTLTTTDWFLQALSVIPRGSWGDVARRFTMIRWAAAPPLLSKRRRRRPPCAAARCRRKFISGQLDEENPFVLISSALLVQPDEGVSVLVMDRIGDNLPQSTEKSRILVIPVGARHKCQQDLSFQAASVGFLVEAPLCLAWLPEELAKVNQDPSSPKTGKENEVKPQYEEHCMRLSRKIGHLGQQLSRKISIEPQTPRTANQPVEIIGPWSSCPSTITAQWSSGARTHPATTLMIALDLSGATTQLADHNASSTRVINQSSGSICMHECQ